MSKKVKKFKNALKFYNSLSGDEREAITRNYVEMSKMDLIELIFQNRPYYNDLEKIVNTHRKEMAQIQKAILVTKKDQKKKLAEFKNGVRYKVTIYTITDDISNKHGSSSQHILESYADEAENDAQGCVTREEDEEYLTDAELNDWAEFNGAKEELAEWRKERELEQFDMKGEEVVKRKSRKCS
jgi:gamma-glutamylcysteine synthetase